MSDASPTQHLYRIVKEGLCIGCGLCESIAGSDTIRVAKVRSGYEAPVAIADPPAAIVDRIYAVCPGLRVNGLPTDEIDGETETDLIWGPIRRIVRIWAGEADVRHRGATGGVLTALAQFLLTSDKVDAVLHVRPGGADPAFGEPTLSFTPEAVLAGAGSRYGPAAPLRTINAVLTRGLRLAVIGKPCDLTALRNYARYDTRINELVRYWLTPVCGGFMPPVGMQQFLLRTGINPADVVRVHYRGEGCPGPTRISLRDGTSREFDYLDFWGEDESQWVLPFRSKVCADGTGESADIAASDTWPGGSPERGASVSDAGTNAVIARTRRGAQLLEDAAAAGAIAIGGEEDARYMDAVQPHQSRKKLAVLARWRGLAAAGRLVPESERLRLEELATALGQPEFEAQTRGTVARIEQGKASEPTPELAEQEYR